MPRFGFSGFENIEALTSPPAAQTGLHSKSAKSSSPFSRNDEQTRVHISEKLSTQLACQSPDGTFLHVLDKSRQHINSFALPLDITHEGRLETTDRNVPSQIQTTLPEWLCSILELDAPIGLICVDGESVRRMQGETENTRQSVGCLCLYTKKGVYILELAYEISPHMDVVESVAGILVSTKSPFESHLSSSLSNEIIRVRQAPQRYDGFATICKRSCIAALVRNTDFSEYSLLVYHGEESQVTSPLTFGLEALHDNRREHLVDFCFAQSAELSLLSSLSILLLKESGDILSAGPIAFEGTVVSSTCLRETLDYLHSVISTEPRSTAIWRQCRAAQQFFLDVFGRVSTVRDTPVTAHIVSQLHRQNHSASWPVQIQGPVLFHNSTEPSPPPAFCLENFGESQSGVVGLAVAKEGPGIDFAIVSPTVLIPRFVFESANDRCDLDDAVCKKSVWVERLSLSLPGDPSSISLVKDHVVDSSLHVVSPKAVFTISTNAILVFNHTTSGARRLPSLQTKAWSCLQSITGSMSVTGVVVSRNSCDEHKLIAYNEAGTPVSVDLAEQQFKYEMEDIIQASAGSPVPKFIKASDSSSSSSSLDSTPALSEIIAPTVKKVQEGLQTMTKFSGDSTMYSDISAETLAAVLLFKERLDQKVVLPTLELKKISASRRQKLESVLQSQRSQLESLQNTEDQRKSQLQAMLDKVETIQSNSVLLLERAEHAYKCCQTLTPNATDAELAYFKDVDRLKERVKYMETEMKRVLQLCEHESKEFTKSSLAESAVYLDRDKSTKMNILLNDMGTTLNQIGTEMKDMSDSVKNMTT